VLGTQLIKLPHIRLLTCGSFFVVGNEELSMNDASWEMISVHG